MFLKEKLVILLTILYNNMERGVYMDKLGDRICALRKKNGLTQFELAEKLNTRKQTIGKYETGIITNIPLSRIQELAKALDTTPEYLLGFTGTEFEAYREILSDPAIKSLLNKLLSIPIDKRNDYLKHLDARLNNISSQ